MDRYEELVLGAKNRGWTRSTAPCYVEEHHIIPRHAGGSEDSSNKVFFIWAEHVLSHKLLYERDGKIEDLWAYNMMRGWMNRIELRREISKKNGSNSKKYRGTHVCHHNS